VIKIGSNLLADEKRLLNKKAIAGVVDEIVRLKKRKIEVILVSSGAMAAGRSLVKGPVKVDDVVQRQVLSSLGQVKLIEAYSAILEMHDLLCCQILVCKQDFRDRHHYLNMRNCFEQLMHDNILPIVNENDAISIDELMFTDNDELAGLIATMIEADALIILTSVDGLFDRHPDETGAQLILEVQPGEALHSYVSTKKTRFGRGGMHTKSRVASHVASLGIIAHVANGSDPSVVSRLLAGERIGTTFFPEKRVSSRKKWIATTEGQEKGVLWINCCTERVLSKEKRAASLLPVGVIKVEGNFQKGDLVRIKNEEGRDLGLGITRCSDEVARSEMGEKGKKPIVHYDYLYMKEVK